MAIDSRFLAKIVALSLEELLSTAPSTPKTVKSEPRVVRLLREVNCTSSPCILPVVLLMIQISRNCKAVKSASPRAVIGFGKCVRLFVNKTHVSLSLLIATMIKIEKMV